MATLVPDTVFQAIFPRDLAALLLVPIHALLGPVLAVLTAIGSMGNGRLAAVLWENGVLFSGIMAFLYADFAVIPSLRINARYYGWRFAGYLSIVFTVSAVGAGVIMHALFSALALVPEPRAGRIQEMAQFRIDYVFFLNLPALLASGVLMWSASQNSRGRARRTAGVPGISRRRGWANTREEEASSRTPAISGGSLTGHDSCRQSRGSSSMHVRISISIFVVAVALNYGWEMAQAVLYEPMGSVAAATWRCFVASLGDGVMVLAIYAAGWLTYRSPTWFVGWSAGPLAFTAAAGVFIAVAVETWG